jgi:hypothetical protein
MRAADFVVVNANTTGPGSLHQAIVDANAAPGADRIIFAIPGSGLHKIDVSQTALPDLTDTVTIDGYTQPGSKPNTAAMGSNAVVLIQVDGKVGGTSPVFVGFAVKAADCILRGLMITGFDRYAHGTGEDEDGAGVEVLASGCVVEGNFIGTNGTSAAGFGNYPFGVFIRYSGAMIGGTAPAARNVIGGDRVFSVGIGTRLQVVNNHIVPLIDIRISGNQIGTNPQETGATNGKVEGAPNGYGIQTYSTSKGGVVIGGTTPEEANLISGNGVGIELDGGNTLVEGNLIGLQPDRATATVNQGIGILIYAADNVVGGLAPGAGNQIAFDDIGIDVSRLANSGGFSISGFRNTFLSNQIYAYTKLGIDLETEAGGGPTPNDYGDGDAGSNDLQNFPVIAAVHKTSGGTTIFGGLNSTPSTTFTIQAFENLAGNSGQRLLGTKQVTTGSSGSVLFQIDSAVVTASGSTFTATATDAKGDTSEFSRQTGPVQLANISTRGFVGTGENILIGGFAVRDSQPKKLAIRALGPSVNVPGRLADPYLQVFDSDGTLLAKNDDWRTGQQQELIASGVAPKSDVESALIVSLASGTYTAQVSGVSGGTGNAIVEVYDLDPFTANSGRLLNISTRGSVGTGNNVLIGGFIARGDVADKVLVRAIGPDLASQGVAHPLQDPTLQVRDSNGVLIRANDNWRTEQEGQITATGLAPQDDRDAAIVLPLPPGSYTAIVRGAGDTTGVALVEFYDLKN